jgi:SAM-dependent methyltransferase
MPSDINSVDPYGGHYQINRCVNCGLMFSSPILDQDDLEILYKLHTAHSNIAPGEEQNARLTMRDYYDLARKYLPAKNRILDIGCDVGYLLEIAKGDGFKELYGIELVEAAAAAAEKNIGAIVNREFYEEVEFPEKYFDLITLVHVVDHLVDPMITLKRAFLQLREGGVVLAVVHNVRTVMSFLLGERYPPFNMYHHYFFSRKTLQKLFEKAGYEVMQVVSSYNVYSLGFLVSRTPLLSRSIKSGIITVLEKTGLRNRSIRLALGNIEIIARRAG